MTVVRPSFLAARSTLPTRSLLVSNRVTCEPFTLLSIHRLTAVVIKRHRDGIAIDGKSTMMTMYDDSENSDGRHGKMEFVCVLCKANAESKQLFKFEWAKRMYFAFLL